MMQLYIWLICLTSLNGTHIDSDDSTVGEAVYDDEYLQKRWQRTKVSSSSTSEGDIEYHWDEDNAELEDSSGYQ